MISLEEMEIKTSSLEPKLFERLKITISKMENVINLTNEEVNELWNNLNDDFNRLNENYQDFLKKFNEPKSDELIQSILFLQFKADIIKYLNDFIKGYQKNIYFIIESINKIDEEKINDLLNKLNSYYKNNPMLFDKFDFQIHDSMIQ